MNNGLSGLALFLISLGATFIGLFLFFPIFFGIARLFGLYTIVEEKQAKVYVLFGKVIAVIDQPGLHMLIFKIGIKAPIVNFLGKCYTLDLRLDQEYLRSTPVNSEEGAPMGIGVWYEMFISDPVAYLFKNADPRGSLSANVSNSTVRCLSNLPLDKMLQDRHAMSQTVRAEVSPKSDEWGYQLGSVYIRKVHFRDVLMIRQIEQKVVNRLRQVTSAIRQAGTNQVDVITSSAERQAATEFAKARSVRPEMIGQALREIGQDPDVLDAVFATLEVERLIKANAEITLIPDQSSEALVSLLASGIDPRPVHPPIAVGPPPPPRQS